VKLKISKPPVRCGFLKIIRDLEGPRERVRSISDTKRSLSRHLLFKNVYDAEIDLIAWCPEERWG
jgi:hypothetical protein